jgi:aspartate aminotransferase-like enzyme
MSGINLRIPGPTPLPPEVIQALTAPMISHRGQEYMDLHKETVDIAKQFFQTTNDLFIFTSSGTGMMEASIVNTLSPGDSVLAVTIGTFGDRFVSCAKALGLDVHIVSFPMGEAADPEVVVKAYTQVSDCKAILITHNETSTAITNDMRSIVDAVRSHGDPLFLVDSVSGMGNLALPVDELQLDVVFTSTQKAWATPPGLALVSVSPKAWKAYEQAKSRKFYFDFKKMKEYAARNQTPETPAVTTLFALHAAMKMMIARGVHETFAYYADLATYTRNALIESGCTLFGDIRHASNVVSACTVPGNIDDSVFRNHMKETYKVVLSGGSGKMKGKLIRVAHMGWVTKADIDEVITAMVMTRRDLQ